VVNRGNSASTMHVDLSGISGVSGGTATVLTGDPTAMNSLAHPTAISPVTRPVGPQGADFRYTFPASSLTVLALSTN
jgi:Alpha-L-arabinofuranosidase C-terminal domain